MNLASSSPSRSSASSHDSATNSSRPRRSSQPAPAPASRDAPLASRSLHGGQARRENSRSGGWDRGLYRRRAPRGAHSSCARKKIRPNARCADGTGAPGSDRYRTWLLRFGMSGRFWTASHNAHNKVFRKETIRCRHIVDTADQGRYRHSRQRRTFSDRAQGLKAASARPSARSTYLRGRGFRSPGIP
jgi:hypothetical protein